MLARDLISEEITPLSLSTDSGEALLAMQQHDILHLPVCNEHELLGIISEEELIKGDPGSPLEYYTGSFDQTYCYENDHLFEVMKKFSSHDLTAVPVVSKNQHYLGTILRTSLYDYYNTSFAWSEPGSIIVIHVQDSQYSLSEISHIIESENAMVLSSIISRPSDTQLVLTLKINKIDVSRIIAALRRYDYDVSASYTEEEVIDNFKERYDALMRFLDV